MHNIPVYPKLVKKFKTNLDQRRLVLFIFQWCFSDILSLNFYMLAELFNMCLKKSYFPGCWKVASLFRVENSSTVKNCCPVSLISVASKVFEKLVNYRFVDHLGKWGLF